MSNQTLPKYDLQELADTLMAIFDGPQDQLGRRWLKLQKLLLEGQPVSPERIAASLQISRDEVNTLLRGAEVDKAGNVVG